MENNSMVGDLKESPNPDRRVRFNGLLGGVRACDLMKVTVRPNERDIATIMSLARKLGREFTASPFTPSGSLHFIEAPEWSSFRDEMGKQFGVYVFDRFYAACVEHLGETAEFGMS